MPASLLERLDSVELRLAGLQQEVRELRAEALQHSVTKPAAPAPAAPPPLQHSVTRAETKPAPGPALPKAAEPVPASATALRRRCGRPAPKPARRLARSISPTSWARGRSRGPAAS